jgi:hypothetical protein
MDARQMKKVIQYEALIALRTNIGNLDNYTELGPMLDQDKITVAQVLRFRKVLDEMIKNAESKI